MEVRKNGSVRVLIEFEQRYEIGLDEGIMGSVRRKFNNNCGEVRNEETLRKVRKFEVRVADKMMKL